MGIGLHKKEFFRVEDITKYSFKKGLKFLFALSAFLFINQFIFSQVNNSSESENSGVVIENEDNLPSENEIKINEADESNLPLNNTPNTGRSIWIFIRMILVLIFIIAIIYIISKLMKKNSNAPSKEDEFLRDVASIAVGPNKSVHVVTLMDQAYMIGVSDNSVNLIARVEDKELINAMNVYADDHIGQKKSLNFSQILDLFTQKKTKDSNENKNDGATRQILNMLRKNGNRLNKKDDEE